MKTTKQYQYSERINGQAITFYGDSVNEILSDVIRIRGRNGVKVPEDPNTLYNIIQPKVTETKQFDGVDSKRYKRKLFGKNSGHKSSRSRTVTLRDAARAATAILKIIPGDHVDKKEYSRRLAVCSGCDLRQQSSDCMGCGGGGTAARLLMSLRTRFKLGYNLDQQVGREFCGFCGCSLSAILVTKLKNYKKEEDDVNNKRPPHCWIRKGSTNYVGEID